MKTINNEALVHQLKWRYATKKFDPTRRISAQDWSTLEEALLLAPSSFGLQPWKFLVVDDKPVREKLRACSWNQSQITDASHLVVFASRIDLNATDVERWIARIAQVRGIPASNLNDYKNMMIGFISAPADKFDVNTWCTRQVYIALGVFLSAAAMLGIDACPMEGFDPVQYDQILGLRAQAYRPVVVATAGYRANDDGYASLTKVRYDRSAVIQHV
ncbi:MAG: NAD(P)H-dependent oxidoreductase [Oligoflexia bacterium]|nr:NAD(P)H-dependent oxidoreductase [Oligoflexia bacterium]